MIRLIRCTCIQHMAGILHRYRALVGSQVDAHVALKDASATLGNGGEYMHLELLLVAPSNNSCSTSNRKPCIMFE